MVAVPSCTKFVKNYNQFSQDTDYTRGIDASDNFYTDELPQYLTVARRYAIVPSATHGIDFGWVARRVHFISTIDVWRIFKEDIGEPSRIHPHT